jgi:hypothetical protein
MGIKTKIFLGLCGVFVALVVIGANAPRPTLTDAARAAETAAECNITLEQFKALRMGSSYSQAVTVLGCEGQEMSRFEAPGAPQFDTVLYSWKGNGMFSSANAMFQGGRMINRAQFGLR